MAAQATYLEAIYRETIRRMPIGAWIGIVELNSIQDMIWPKPDQRQVESALEATAGRHITPGIYKTYGRISLLASGRQESDLGHNLQWEVAAQVP